MTQRPGDKDVSSDLLLAAIERAAAVIERLQRENAALAGRMREYEAAAGSAAEALARRDGRIRELEQSAAALKKDADWCRWFRRRYGDSTFFSHIEREYQSVHADGGDGAGIPLGPLVRPEEPVSASDPVRRA